MWSKYQLSGAVRVVVPFSAPFVEELKAHKSQFESELSQVVSVAGAAARSDINYTKVELTFYTERGQPEKRLRMLLEAYKVKA